jgi:hypothetical protein
MTSMSNWVTLVESVTSTLSSFRQSQSAIFLVGKNGNSILAFEERDDGDDEMTEGRKWQFLCVFDTGKTLNMTELVNVM